jgi:DNA-binding response OmpR family regulator
MVGPEVLMERGEYTAPESGTRRQLLVVDDDTDIQKLLSRTFALMGYDVNLAGNGREAMNLFLANSYDLVITDFQMPLMDGSQLSHLVKERSPSTPVVMITGGFDDARLEKLKGRNIDAVLLKPFKLKEIQETVRSLLSSGS